MPRIDWTKQQQLLALRLYCQLPFGQLHQRNPDIIAVATAINRTPSAVAMKACNFASLDPAIKQKGLGNVSRADRALWDEFQEESETIADSAEAAYQQIVTKEDAVPTIKKPSGPTESIREVKTRRVQSFFRKTVLISYGNQCAISGLKLPELIIASHIIPWSENEKRRADPTNGIALNALYDKAFDRCLITFDEQLRVVLSSDLSQSLAESPEAQKLFEIEGRSLRLPTRFRPDEEALAYHREKFFSKAQEEAMPKM